MEILRRAALLLASGGILLIPSSSPAHPDARYYRGEITVSTSWEGVIRLTGTVIIGEGVTVTVDPGTEVLVQPNVDADIIVRGRLFVRGTSRRPVVFAAAGGCPAGRWGGIVFARGATGILENVRIHCAATGIGGELGGVTRSGITVDVQR